MPTGKRRIEVLGHWLSRRPNSDSWCATWFDRAARQTRRSSLGTQDLQEAERRLAEFALSRARPKEARPDDVPLAEILMRYWHEHMKTKASAEAARIALGYWSDFFDAATVAETTPARVDQFIAALMDRGHGRSYISRTLSVGRAALMRAHKRGELQTVPCIRDVPREDPPERYLLSQEEASRLIAAADQEHLRAFLILAFCTAARPGAIFELTWPQIDLGRRIVDLNQPRRVRTKKSRPVLPIGDILLAHLEKMSRRGLYLVSYGGKPVREIKRAFRAARARAGLRREVSPYCIRHTIATVLRERGVPEWECAAWLGHKLPGYRTTERYARHRPDYLRNAVDAIDGWMSEALGAATPRASDFNRAC